ncbi:MAG TPA: VacJ family lipoprotein [Novosphingobium sp.]|nr:VacJ family lipoprotein [Novosphingobium sp.]
MDACLQVQANTPNQPPAGVVPAEAAPAGQPPAPAQPAAEPSDEPEHNITVSAPLHVKYDPLERVNAVSFAGVQAVDKVVVAPMARGYEHIVPEPLRDGIHNMVHNLREPYIAANFLLQHRVGKSAETVARLVINTTLGVGGLFDIAKRKPFHLPRRPNGFADTMGFYGVKTGPYLFLPLVGPTTIRDLAGNILDRSIMPLALGKVVRNPVYVFPALVFGAMDRRLQNNDRINRARESSNPYTIMREDYLLRRRLEIEGLHYHRPRKGAPQAEAPKPADPAKPAETPAKP